MSADIIQFALRRHQKRDVTDLSASTAGPDDLVMDHVDKSPWEYVPSFVMPGLVPGIHALNPYSTKDVEGRAQASGSDGVLQTATPGHDVPNA
jgi:hypothetical protein